MPKLFQRPWLASRCLPAAVVGFSLVVLGGAIVLSMLGLRARLQQGMANHDGEALSAVALMQQTAGEAEGEPAGDLSDPAEQFDLALSISRLKGVLGLRLFSPEGEFVNAAPAFITEGTLPPADLAALRSLRPVSHYHPKAHLAEIDLLSEGLTGAVPLLVVNVPLHRQGGTQLAGVAQFIVQGEGLARDYAALDRQLALQALLLFLIGGGILAGTLLLTFRRLERAHRLLAERTAGLLQANQELALAAKTSAVGAVAAHLIHGLRNPLSGLQSFVNSQLAEQGPSEHPEWNEAVATTRRMQGLIGEVVRILGEEQTKTEYEMTLAELAEVVGAKVAPRAHQAGIGFTVKREGEGVFSNQEANLIALILENLLHNALEATPAGKSVQLTLQSEDARFIFEVRDEGPGLPEAVRARLFTPCPSTKEGGSGIGLAISKQLASHLDGTLELRHNSASGCLFRLVVPRKSALPRRQPNSAAVAA